MPVEHTPLRHGGPPPPTPDRWAQLFEAFPLPIATLAADGTVLERNHAARDLVGAESGKTCFTDFVLPAYRHALTTAIGAARDGRVSRVDVAYPAGEGTAAAAEITLVPWSSVISAAAAVPSPAG